MMTKRRQKGPQQYCFLGPKRRHEPPRFDFWCDAEKPYLFIGPQTTNNNLRSTKKRKRAARAVPRFQKFAEPGGWRGARRALYYIVLN